MLNLVASCGKNQIENRTWYLQNFSAKLQLERVEMYMSIG